MKISTLLFICAIALSATAAYYSIVGLATIFSSAFYAVVIMAGILEISKLVVASWLYQKWEQIAGLVKVYLTTAVVILMMITSLGIFGFLSKAHVEQNLNSAAVNLRIEQIDVQISSTREVIQRYQTQLEQLDRSINVQLEANRASQALAARQRQTAERDQIRQRLDAEQQKILDLSQQRQTLRQQVNVLESEVGPIRYVAEFFFPAESVDLEKAVRYMIIVLVLVFDPLAVLMLIAANMSLDRERRKTVGSNDPENEHQPHTIKEENLGPTIGDVISIDGRPIRWWSGTSWERIDDPPEPLQQIDISELAKTMDHIMDERLSKIIPNTPPISMDDIREIVKSSMDEWLTKVANEPQSRLEDLTPTVANEETNLPDASIDAIQPTQEASESSRVAEPLAEPMARTEGRKTVDDPKAPPPSWL